MKEIWKPVVGWENLYEISNLGRVKSHDRLTQFGRNFYIKKGRILNPGIRKDGYYSVTLCNKTIHKAIDVHLLVAQAFLNKQEFKSMPSENRNDIDLRKLNVNHKDENKLNNCVDNLEWCTVLYNINYGTGKIRGSKKREKPVCQYDLKDNFINEYYSITDAVKNTGINGAHIGQCCKGERKTAGKFKWKFINKQ